MSMVSVHQLYRVARLYTVTQHAALGGRGRAAGTETVYRVFRHRQDGTSEF